MNSGGPGRREQLAPASALALQLWLASMLCWWIIGITCMVLLCFLGVRTWQLCRPE